MFLLNCVSDRASEAMLFLCLPVFSDEHHIVMAPLPDFAKNFFFCGGHLKRMRPFCCDSHDEHQCNDVAPPCFWLVVFCGGHL